MRMLHGIMLATHTLVGIMFIVPIASAAHVRINGAGSSPAFLRFDNASGNELVRMSALDGWLNVTCEAPESASVTVRAANFVTESGIDVSAVLGAVDSTPTDGSDNLVSSDGVYDWVTSWAQPSGSYLTSVPSGTPADRIGSGSVSNTEFGYLDGVGSSIQTQLNGKQSGGADNIWNTIWGLFFPVSAVGGCLGGTRTSAGRPYSLTTCSRSCIGHPNCQGFWVARGYCNLNIGSITGASMSHYTDNDASARCYYKGLWHQ